MQRDGFIEDDDADDIDYDELLETMKEDTKKENEQRTALGYETLEFVGWASPSLLRQRGQETALGQRDQL